MKKGMDKIVDENDLLWFSYTGRMLKRRDNEIIGEVIQLINYEKGSLI